MSGANFGGSNTGNPSPAGPPGGTETVVLEVRESRRSFGPVWLVLGFLMLGLPFIGRQKVAISNQRVRLEQGFWTKVRDDIEIFVSATSWSSRACGTASWAWATL